MGAWGLKDQGSGSYESREESADVVMWSTAMGALPLGFLIHKLGEMKATLLSLGAMKNKERYIGYGYKKTLSITECCLCKWQFKLFPRFERNFMSFFF